MENQEIQNAEPSRHGSRPSRVTRYRRINGTIVAITPVQQPVDQFAACLPPFHQPENDHDVDQHDQGDKDEHDDEGGAFGSRFLDQARCKFAVKRFTGILQIKPSKIIHLFAKKIIRISKH